VSKHTFIAAAFDQPTAMYPDCHATQVEIALKYSEERQIPPGTEIFVFFANSPLHGRWYVCRNGYVEQHHFPVQMEVSHVG
jgi:hypothetical protein